MSGIPTGTLPISYLLDALHALSSAQSALVHLGDLETAKICARAGGALSAALASAFEIVQVDPTRRRTPTDETQPRS